MKLTVEDIYESACKIASNTAHSFSNTYRGNIGLEFEEFFGDMMIKLVQILDDKEFENEVHFFKHFKISCTNLAKSKVRQERYTQKSGYTRTEEEDGAVEENYINTVSIFTPSPSDDSIDLSASIEDLGGIDVVASMMEEERYVAFKESLDDDLCVNVLETWADPTEELLEMLRESQANTEVKYHQVVRKHLKLTADLYNYAKDIIYVKVREMFPEESMSLGIA